MLLVINLHFRSSCLSLWTSCNLIQFGCNLCIFSNNAICFIVSSDIVAAELRNANLLQLLTICNNAYHDYLEEILKFSDVQAIITSNDEYDLIIGELFFFDAIFAFGYKFNAPVIAVRAPSLLRADQSWILGNPISASHIPNLLSLFTEKMSLLARIKNVAFNLLQGIDDTLWHSSLASDSYLTH